MKTYDWEYAKARSSRVFRWDSSQSDENIKASNGERNYITQLESALTVWEMLAQNTLDVSAFRTARKQ